MFNWNFKKPDRMEGSTGGAAPSWRPSTQLAHASAQPSAHSPALHQPAPAHTTAHTPAPGSIPTPSPAQVLTLETVSQLPAIKGEALAVSTSLRGQCLVLDHGMTVTSVVALADAYESNAFTALRASLASMNCKVTQFVVSTPLFAEIDQIVKALTQKQQVRFASLEHGGARLYEELVARAFALKATDLHFYISDPEKTGSTSHVRLRVGGRMRSWVSFDTQVLLKALSSAYGSKSTVGTNSQSDYSVSRPTATMTKHTLKDASGRLRSLSTRFNSRPTVSGGAKATARILETDVDNVKIPTLKALGFEPSQIQMLDLALRRNQGLILLIGGTGGGKSTTLRTMMTELPSLDELELYTVEDPVEYYLPGFANQLSIARASDEDEGKFRARLMSALRDLMRQDPDVVMVGEIRDAEGVMLVAEIVNTGHRALTTVHSNGVIDGLDRLTGKVMQLQPTTLANDKFLSVCVYQKLIPLLCPHCKQPARDHLNPALVQTIIQKFGLDINGMYVASKLGCPHCRVDELGIRGTVGVTVAAEVMSPDRQLREHIKAMDWNAATDHWRSQRKTGFADPDMTGKTAFEHALYKAAAGLVSVLDIETDFEPLASYEIHGQHSGAES